MPDARYYNGPDERDDLSADTELDACQECGAAWDEACDADCPCAYCTGKRAREAARRALETGDAA